MAVNFRLILLISAAFVAFSLEQVKKPKTCEVSRFRTQPNFNLSQFMGEWHIISDKGIFPYQHKLDKLVNVFTNIRIYGVLKDGHQAEINIVSRVLGVCATSKLTVQRPDFKFPSKLEASSPDAWIPYMKEARPVWVAWTDGDAALLYSCGKEAEGGNCEADKTHSWTLNRHTDGHSPGQQTKIDNKITEFCMDPVDFQEVKRSWPCSDFDVEALEDDDDEDDDDPADDTTADGAKDAAADDGQDDGEEEDEPTEGTDAEDAGEEDGETEAAGEDANKAEL